MDFQEKLNLVKSVAEGGEIIGEDELKSLFEKSEKEGRKPVAYDGFEPSGRIHIAQGLVRAINVNKMTKAGFKFIMWVADWHAAANHKYGGDLEKIQIVGKYFIEVWKASGMDLENVEFKWVSDAVKDPDYWKIVLDVSRNSNLPRILRTVDIMGRSEKDTLTASQILYPCMQCADIFYLKADVCQLGLDQRKVNMLAREIGEQIGFWKPIVVSHPMMSGLLAPNNQKQRVKIFCENGDTINLENNLKLKFLISNEGKEKRIKIESEYENTEKRENGFSAIEISLKENEKTLIELENEGLVISGELELIGYSTIDGFLEYEKQLTPIEKSIAKKMSKSKPDTAIFMTDSPEDVSRKLLKAYCPMKVVEDNPVLEYYKFIVFERFDSVSVVNRNTKQKQEFDSYKDLEKEFVEDNLDLKDLKLTLAEKINELLENVRKHFEEDENAKNLLKQVENFQITR